MESRNDEIIVGVDILPGYSVDARNKQPHYAAVFLKNGEIVTSYEDLSFSRLIRLIWEYRAKIIAVDNVFELASSYNDLVKLSQLLPPETRIVQVTGWGPQAVNIKTVAKSMGLDVRGKLSPLKTAYLAALIAYKGGGSVIKLLEEKTKIIVSRGRSVSHGGMSYDRYKRSIRAGILTVTKEIRKLLDNNGFDYDLVFKKSRGGLEKSIFIVYAPRDKLYGLIKPFKSKSIRLTIKPVYKNKIVFEHSTPRRRRGLILGIDPGVNTGIAVLDLSGSPVLLYSSKNLDRSEIINMISHLGEVVVVSTDVSQPPELVRKIASMLNAKIYTPKSDLSTEEKAEIVNRLASRYPWLEVQDSHERDALAAAYKAFTHIKDKLSTIESYLDEFNLDIDKERIKIEVVKGKSFAEALEEELNEYLVSREEKTVEPTSRSVEAVELEKKYIDRIRELKSRIRYYEAMIRDLEKQLREKEMLIDDLKIELRILKQTSSGEALKRKIYVLNQELETLRRELEDRDEKIKELTQHISSLKKLVVDTINGKYILVPKINNLCLNEVVKALKKMGVNKTIYVEELYPLNMEALNVLRENKIAILTSRRYEELYKEIRVPIIHVKPRETIEEYVVVSSEILENVEEAWREIEELNSRDEYKRIIKLIKKYQEERKRKLRKQG